MVELLGKKARAELGSGNVDSRGSEMSSFAQRQMEKMGWKQGEGLGKNSQGISTYVKVKKRVENSGIGMETLRKEEHQVQWWCNVYDKVASSILVDDSDDEKSKKKKKKKDKKKSKKRKGPPTDEELFKATGGKLFGRRAYGSCTGKLKRTS